MRLKRLELFGFKSFADKTVMDFGRTTLTGIVGPNGCGKSNVVDAVRWVLGETRPTSMRGSGMTDVIFKGSASRPAMGTAEVTMVLDNGAEVLADRGAEVAITRRLYASGEGEYAIDGQRVRLKDVKDLLFDTGLGSRGYSVLEQGRIDAVLSANPAQRRAIFEEAAGISRYRQRRHETELRLKRCEQDVARLDDVMGELRSRVRSLKIQAGKAERYVVAKAAWTEGRTRFLAQRLVGFDRSLEDIRPRIAELEETLGGLRERRQECEEAILARENERREIVERLGARGDDASRVSGDIRALDERRSQLSMRIASWTASADEERERAEALEVQLGEREAELVQLEEQIASLEESTRTAEERASGLRAQARELEGSYKALRAEVQAQNDRVLERLHERTAAENRVVHLREALPPARERLERATHRLESTRAQSEEQAAARAACALELEGATADLERADTAANEAAEALRGEREGLAELRRTRGEWEVQRAALQSRVDALLDRESELEDLSGGARRVLEAAAEGSGTPCREDELLGLVADHLRADVRLARAIDAVLGDRASALVARDAHVARRIVDWCRTEEIGQVGVVVPPGVGAPDCPPPSDYALFARFGAGVEGRLGELVRCAEEMRPLVHSLFCDVVLVSSLDIALDLVGREPGWRFVTPRGELVDAAGLTGGHREVTHGFVGRRSSAADLVTQIERLDVQLAERDREIAAAEARIADLEARLTALSGERDAARQRCGNAEAAAAAAAARLADLQGALEGLTDESLTAAHEVESAEAELADVEARRVAAAEAFEAENERLEQMEKSRRSLEAERETLRAEESQAQVEVSSAKAELGGLTQRIESGKRLLTETRSEIERSRTRAANYGKSAEEGNGEVADIATEADGLRETLEGMEAEIAALREEERSGQERISQTRKDAEVVQGELDGLSDSLGALRLEAQKADIERAEVIQRAGEELEADAEMLFAAFEKEAERLLEPAEEAESDQGTEAPERPAPTVDNLLLGKDELRALEKEVAEHKKQLDKLGPVNLDAVHELEEVGGRLDHLEGQATDLAEARKTLMDTIRTIDEESRRLFVETFEEVRGNFQRIFRLLFGGGKAAIRLEEGEDVLDAGVDIVARPPGRELLAIGLLSGGQRTMTALALLFAVFEARPSPFCVLDEVDAALDDANIDRFLGMLEGFRETTQFIVVTHNKGTMAASEALYGVTMQVKGVSRFVTVELDEVDEFAPESTGSAERGAARESGGQPGDPDEDDDAPSADRTAGGALADESGEPIKVIPGPPQGADEGALQGQPTEAAPISET